MQGPYDTVLASHFFHHFTRDECIAFMRRARNVVSTGNGARAPHLVIHDFLLPETPYSMMTEGFNIGRLFSSAMLVWTRAGKVFTASEYRDMLAAAGWKLERVVPHFPGTWLYV
jgi:hypothetical protein